MNPELKDVWEHMRDLGLHALAHANRHTCYSDPAGPRWSELGVLQAAHAAELLVKARIAQEHPLLIFEQLPRPPDEVADLNLVDLFEHGRAIQWSDLPATMGRHRTSATKRRAVQGVRTPSKRHSALRSAIRS